MEKKVEQFIEKHHLIPRGATLVVGVSGGADSMALFHFLNQRKEKYEIQLICCSVDHGLRGEESEEEVLFVKDIADRFGVPFEGAQVNVLRLKSQDKIGTQQAARALRFEVFGQVLRKYRSKSLVLAQHGDDQIESMLMQHVRGGNSTSLSGMPVKRQMEWGTILRPFLCLTKEDILNYCQRYQIAFRNDPSNQSDDYMRNRFRHHILPLLKEENPLVHERFQQQSEWLSEDEAFLNQLAVQRLAQIKRSQTVEHCVLSKSGLLSSPVPLQRRMLHLILTYLYNSQTSKQLHQSIHIDSLLSWLKQESGSGEFSLPDPLIARKHEDNLVIKSGSISFMPKSIEPKKIPFPGHLSTTIGEFKTEILDHWVKPSDDQRTFIADRKGLNLPLSLRCFQSGDRMTLLGHGGTKKVSRLFIDSKVPKEWRASWPIIVDGNGHIIWVPLLHRSGEALCDEKTTSFMQITFIPSKGFGRIY
ncbi:tRNA lysidine(34) synthetase TilS [Pullulanibacillus sp. KACC 23026]|uniref:tRNA lysidine(34) synthetase TilS n=1 Tax=Pullulanibacillus sp. KACC 23026 TaxID=3028315 RepID=UPI0023B1448C|nr:tRNA lysidine(34) synthetase TilS [Pullulanibacillus sp. KACC 23026]WEG12714.1 tRNA lysidine(34) synthetase TilS [Pullulanibacillus sp. KACC 23026]